MNYIYDGSFEGLLTAVYEAYYRKQTPERVLSGINHQLDILSVNIIIKTDTVKYEKVYNSIKTKISEESLMKVYYVHLSQDEDAGTLIYKYLKLGWKIGSKIDLHLSDDTVLNVENLSRKVSGERHRLLGLLRFHKLNSGVFYGPINPDYNVTELLAPHFAERLSDQNWVIHDVKRSIAAIFDCISFEWYITDFDTNQYSLMKEDSIYQDLWKQFFDAIAIKNKINPQLQRQHMPSRYWRYLVEKS